MGNTLSRTAGWAILGFLSACGETDDPFVPIEPNRDPVAAIAADALGERGAVIDLDASGSHDPDGDALTYSWSFVSRPATSTATIGAAGPEQASFVPDALGTYVVRLELSDGAASATDDHSIVIDIPRLRGGTISTDSTIPNTIAPPEEPDYRVSANHTLTIVAAVTIEPGVTIALGENARVHVATDGSLSAVGTPDLPIRMLGADTVSGYWGGIEIVSHSPLNEFAFVEVAHAGPSANVRVEGILRASNSTFRNAQTWGLIAVHVAQLPEFRSNAFDGNGFGAIAVPVHLLGALDTDSDYAGSDGDHVGVLGGFVTDTQTWRSINTSYRVVAFAGSSVIEGSVTVEPGVDFVMEELTVIHIFDGGSLTAIGTATDSITFRGASGAPAAWWGFGTNPTSAITMSYVRIGHGGIDTGSANIRVNGTVTLSNSHVHDSGTYGVDIGASGTFSANDVTYSGNALGDVHQD